MKSSTLQKPDENKMAEEKKTCLGRPHDGQTEARLSKYAICYVVYKCEINGGCVDG